MSTHKATQLWLAVCCWWGVVGATAWVQAESYTEASFTRLHNDVKVVKDANSRAAKEGETIGAVSSVATGTDSRAEMRFPDKSLTRLGANSRFTLRGDKRTLELDEGVLMLQVPKKIGGAKVRTAAVTAAVTGTTVLFEYLPGGFIKLIVVEGSVDLYFTNKPGRFKTANAGQMILMQEKSTVIPDPVDIDLGRLLKTSKLISADDLTMPNNREVQQALRLQKKELGKGGLVSSNLLIPGRGTMVTLTGNVAQNVLQQTALERERLAAAAAANRTAPTLTAPTQQRTITAPTQPVTAPATTVVQQNTQPIRRRPLRRQPPLPLPTIFTGVPLLIAGTSVLNETSEIRTNPHVTAYNSVSGAFNTSEGVIYDGTVAFPYFAFGTNTSVINPNFQTMLASNPGWAVFKFESLLINGSPNFVFPDGVSNDVVLATVGALTLGEDAAFGAVGGGGAVDAVDNGMHLEGTGLDHLVLYSETGNVTLNPGFGIYGDLQHLSLVAASAFANVSIFGPIDILTAVPSTTTIYYGGNLLVSAGQDVDIAADVSAMEVDAKAGRNINVQAGTTRAANKMTLSAQGSINVTSSAILKVLARDPAALMRLEAMGDINVTGDTVNANLEGYTIDMESYQGNINIHDSQTTFTTEVFKARTFADSGWITIGNSTLNATQVLKLYAEGNNGGVRFVGKTTLDSAAVHINGKTVEISPGVVVTVPRTVGGPSVYTDNPQFDTVTRTTTGKGVFSADGINALEVIHKPFKDGSRPAY